MFHANPVWVLLKAVLCLWQSVWPPVPVSSVLREHGCIHVLIWDTYSALLLFELVNMKAACAFLKLSRGPASPGHLAGLQQLEGRQSEQPIMVWIQKRSNMEVFYFEDWILFWQICLFECNKLFLETSSINIFVPLKPLQWKYHYITMTNKKKTEKLKNKIYSIFASILCVKNEKNLKSCLKIRS